MAITTVSPGTSQTCTPTTEHTLDTETAAGVYVFQCNLTTAVNGDAFRIRVYTKTLTGDTAECLWDVMYANDQGNIPIIHSPPLVSMFSLAITLTQTAGSSRTIPWSLMLVST